MSQQARFPALRYQVRRFYGPGMASPAEEREGYYEDTFELDPKRVGILAMHCWNLGEPDGPYPYTDGATDASMATWVPRAATITNERIAPLIEAARKAGVWVCHSAPESYGKRYPQHRDGLDELGEDALKPGPGIRHAGGSVRRFSLKERYAKSYGPSFPGGVWETHPDSFDIARSIRPQAEDGVIITTQQLDHHCRKRGIDTLLFVGFMTDYCVMSSPGGIEDMCGLGYRCILLRDCTTAHEYADTIATGAMTKAAIRRVEYAYGWSANSRDVVAACEALLHDAAPSATDRERAGHLSDVGVQEAWARFERAAQLIPGGSGTMSKAPNRTLHPNEPPRIAWGKGCRVWDESGRCYIDYRNGLGPVTLGYANERINDAIRRQLELGTVYGHPSPLESELAERLVRAIPCAEQVRYLKTGGEAMAAALRVARAHTRRPVVVSCGYHGWLNNTGGIERGSPEEITRLTRSAPFDISAFERIVQEEGAERIAALTLSMPYAEIYPDHPFYRQIRELADSIGALLIFDEIVTGFRLRIGGAQEFFGVTPDLAVFSKGMAAGMPLSVLCGRAEYMEQAAKIPVSSTFSGETLALAAAIEALNIYEQDGVIEHLWARGEQLMDGLNQLFQAHHFPAKVVGLAPCSMWTPTGDAKEGAALAEAFTDACYAEGVSFYRVLYPNFAHTEADIAETLERCDRALARVQTERGGEQATLTG